MANKGIGALSMNIIINPSVVQSETAVTPVRIAHRRTYAVKEEWPVANAVMIGYQNRNKRHPWIISILEKRLQINLYRGSRLDKA